MKTKTYSGGDERMLLTALIVNSKVLGKIVSGLKGEKKPFRSRWSNQIYQWCATFHAKYEKAPRALILSIFRQWALKEKDEASVALIEKFLTGLSDDYKALSREMNQDYVVDMAWNLFNLVRYERLNVALEEALGEKDVARSRDILSGFQPVQGEVIDVVDVLGDYAAWEEAVELTEADVMVKYPGAIGEFFGDQLQRDGFIAFMAPEKRGKSFWLIDMAWRAAFVEKRKTLFFSVGDMSRRQTMQRFAIRAARRPIGTETLQYPKRLRAASGDTSAKVKRELRVWAARITKVELKSAHEDLKKKTASDHGLLRLECTANSTTTVADISLRLQEYVRDGWVPDVVVIDYADILAPEQGASGMEFRHQQNETWKALRRLSQQFHCLVVTATQSDAASYETVTIKRKNFSEDKRKLSHVTGMVGINQTEEEKHMGVYRLNWVLLREGSYYESRCVTTAGNLALANPAIVSAW